jgi:hypothetical protein
MKIASKKTIDAMTLTSAGTPFDAAAQDRYALPPDFTHRLTSPTILLEIFPYHGAIDARNHPAIQKAASIAQEINTSK